MGWIQWHMRPPIRIEIFIFDLLYVWEATIQHGQVFYLNGIVFVNDKVRFWNNIQMKNANYLIINPKEYVLLHILVHNLYSMIKTLYVYNRRIRTFHVAATYRPHWITPRPFALAGSQLSISTRPPEPLTGKLRCRIREKFKPPISQLQMRNFPRTGCWLHRRSWHSGMEIKRCACEDQLNSRLIEFSFPLCSWACDRKGSPELIKGATSSIPRR